MRKRITYCVKIFLVLACAMQLQQSYAFPLIRRSGIRVQNDSTTLKLSRIPAIQLNDWRTLDYDTIDLRPSYALVPLIFRHQMLSTDTIAGWSKSDANYTLDVDRSWLNDDIAVKNRENGLRYRTMTNNPDVVIYNANELPEAPKEFISVVDPKNRTLSIVPIDYKKNAEVDAKPQQIKLHNWLHTFVASLQFSQAYMSENWYQGSNNVMNVLSDLQWTVQLNQNLHPNYIFSNTVRYKLGINSAPNDELRSYSISDDLFQLNTQVGIKAVKKWYYSASLQFKTQMLNNYKSNSNERKAAFMSPGELNVGVGITYSNASKDGWRTFNMSISPVSYNMKICKSDINPLPTDFGINDGHHTSHDVGSKLESKMNIKFNQSISWSSRLYVFTNYEYVQGDWENTFNFNVTRHLITQFYTHLRYDKSAAKNEKWNYWQFKEILSFGLTYRFATN